MGAKTIVKQIAVAILSLNSNKPFSFGTKIPAALNRAVVFLLLLILFFAEIFRVYLVMPFLGSQRSQTVDIAYWLSMHIVWIRVLTLAVTGIALLWVIYRRRAACKRV